MQSKRSAKRRKYYQPADPEDNLRYKLADGKPVHELLHYQHARDKLREDVRDLCRAGEILHEVDHLLEELLTLDSPREVDGWAAAEGVFSSMRVVARDMMVNVRQLLVIKLMKEPGDDGK